MGARSAMRWGQYILAINGAVFGCVGLAFLMFPAAMAQFVTGGAPSTPSGLTDMRATYGGVLTAVGVLLLGAVCLRPAQVSLGLIGLTAVLGAMAVGRVLGMILDGAPNIMMYVFLAYEIVFVALSTWVLKRMKLQTGSATYGN